MIGAAPSGEVAAFFAAIVPYYRGDADLPAVERARGASPSGPVRMAFYQRLMGANRRRILRHVCPTLHAIVTTPERAGLGPLPTWDVLAARYTRAHPPTGWDPNALGAELATWLAGEPDLPPALASIAAWSWATLTAARAPRRTCEALDPSVVAAAYPFDVAAWMRAFEAGRAAPLEAAHAAGPACVLVAYRDPTTLTPRVLRPSPAELIVLAQAAGEPMGDAGVDLGAARARLVQLGLVAPEDV